MRLLIVDDNAAVRRLIKSIVLPANHASKEFQIFHKAKLTKIPDSMPDETAASFSIGAQTTYAVNINPT